MGSETLSNQLIVVEGQLHNELESSKQVITQLQTEKEAVRLEADELRAEVALLQARLRRADVPGQE